MSTAPLSSMTGQEFADWCARTDTAAGTVAGEPRRGGFILRRLARRRALRRGQAAVDLLNARRGRL